MINAYENGATKFYFQPYDPDDENSNLYYIYTYADDGTTLKYVGHDYSSKDNLNRIYLTNDVNNTSGFSELTLWEVDFNASCFSIKDNKQYDNK